MAKYKQETEGFGYIIGTVRYYELSTENGETAILTDKSTEKHRVFKMDLPKWNKIKADVEDYFNKELEKRNLKKSHFVRYKTIKIDRMFGRSLELLFWVQNAYPSMMMTNWKMLRLEEHWWLWHFLTSRGKEKLIFEVLK